MTRRFQISLRLMFVALFLFALALGLLRLNTSVHSASLGVRGFVLLGFSIGWPIGFLFGGHRGAIVGGVFGVISLFIAKHIYITIALRNTPDF